MITRLVKHESEFALVIARDILERLGIDAETPLRVEVVEGALVVTPAHEGDSRKRFEAALKEANRKFGGALKRLAN